MPSQVFTTVGTTVWTWPGGVTSVTAECLGGGGGGGAGNANPSTGGGGKGGGYASVAITKGAEASLSVIVGAGGAAAANGNPSSVTQSSVTMVLGSGGGLGATTATLNTNGAGATALNGTAVGTTIFAGGNGGTGNYVSGTAGSGAGGGAAGPTSVGGAASVNVAGIVGTGTWLDGGSYQKAGAAGVGNSTAGANGTNYGAGASGGKTNSGSNKAGGAGAQGIVVLTWASPPSTGTLTQTLASAALVSDSDITVTAGMSRTLAPATLSSDGTVVTTLPPITASLAQTLTPATLGATGTVADTIRTASLTQTLAPATVASTGSVLPVRTGSLTQTLVPATLVSTASAQPARVASLTQTLAPAALTSESEILWVGAKLNAVETGPDIVGVAQNGPGRLTDVVNLYSASGSLLDWKYLNNTQTAPTTSLVAGQVTFSKASLPLGDYKLSFQRSGSSLPYASVSFALRSEPQICLEMEFLGKNQGWTIVRDWLVNPGLVWHRGLPGIGILDLIADIGTLHFTLDNSEKNSVGKVGYYSPDHANKRYGFYLNIGVRVRIGQAKRFTGVISSVDPLPGKFGARTVQIECTDWMGIADRTRIENLPVLVNKRGDEVFRTLLDSLPGSAHPDGIQADSSPDIYPYTLDRTRDEQTVLRDELYRLCTSGMALIYIQGDGILVYENRGRRAAITASVDTFTDSHGFTSSHGREAIVNRTQTTIHPRLPSFVDVVLYSMPQPMELVPGTPMTVLGPWSDPANPSTRVGAVSLITPLVPTTDYVANARADGSGADLTASVVVLAGLSGNATSFTVSLPQGGFLTKLQQRGKPLYDYGQTILTWEDTTSIAQFGVAAQQIDMPYTADPNLALEVAQFVVYNGAFPLTNVAGFTRIVDIKNAIELQRSIGRQISDRISIVDAVTGLSKPFFINAIDETITEGRVQTQWILTPGDATGYWLLEVDGFTELDITTRLGFGQILGHVDIVHQDTHGDQIHYDGVHVDTHTDNVHVDVTHVDYITHTDVTSHSDLNTHVDDPGHSDSVAHTDWSDHVDVWSHDDVAHQDVPHQDGAHTDIAQVYWHTDVAHSDVAHYDVYYDSPHQDIAHQDAHDDWRDYVPSIYFNDHMDCNASVTGHNSTHLDCYSVPYYGPDPNPNGQAHEDSYHTDNSGHVDMGGWYHSDWVAHSDIIHQDSHGDSHADYHADQRHVDEGYFDPHQDVPYQAAHGDTPHYDVPHYDVTQVYVPHTDVYPHSDTGAHHDQNIHTDTSNHSDTVIHDDVTSHADNNVHSDTPHTDISHGDVPHQDVAHSDVPHQDTHQDFHGDSN